MRLVIVYKSMEWWRISVVIILYTFVLVRCGRYPPVVRTAVPVDGRFEHIVLSCNATSDHAIIWIERESSRALEVSYFQFYTFYLLPVSEGPPVFYYIMLDFDCEHQIICLPRSKLHFPCKSS